MSYGMVAKQKLAVSKSSVEVTTRIGKEERNEEMRKSSCSYSFRVLSFRAGW